MKTSTTTLLAFGAGAFVAVSGLQLLPASSFDSTSTPPQLIGGARSQNAKVEALDVGLGRWQGWFIHSDNGYRQVAYSMPGQPGVVLGELYDDSGSPVGPKLVQARERGVTSIEDLAGLSTWVSSEFVNPPSIPELQGRILASPQQADTGSPRYLMLDPFDQPARSQRELILGLMEEPNLRVIPVPSSGPGAFDGMHAIMEAAYRDGSDTTLEAFHRALAGEDILPVSGEDDPERQQAFMAFSKNVSLQRRLGVEQLPSLIQQTADGGIEVVTLRSWAANKSTN